jgi:hypothetical protein
MLFVSVMESHITWMLFVLHVTYSAFRDYYLLTVNRPKHVVKIKIKIRNYIVYCCVWLKPWNYLLSFSLITLCNGKNKTYLIHLHVYGRLKWHFTWDTIRPAYKTTQTEIQKNISMFRNVGSTPYTHRIITV